MFRFSIAIRLVLLLALVGVPATGFSQQRLQRQGFRFFAKDKTSITLSDGGKAVWTYNFAPITDENVPENDHRRTRGCYIHPLYGINGEILTDDFPKDHYHHHGVFWTWPHVGIPQDDGTVSDYSLWEDKGIKQKFVRWLDRSADARSATLAVENGWYVGEKKVMIEKVTIRTSHQKNDPTIKGTRVVDLEFVWIPTDRPITLRGAEGKSYGGLTVRFRPPPAAEKEPDTAITSITIPEGIAKTDLPEKPLPWADYTSRFGYGEQRSGAAIFIPPSHPDFPPTWLTRYYGAMCVGWPGVEGKTFQPGEKIRLNYRIWIHETPVDVPQIEKAYQEYIATQPGGSAK